MRDIPLLLITLRYYSFYEPIVLVVGILRFISAPTSFSCSLVYIIIIILSGINMCYICYMIIWPWLAYIKISTKVYPKKHWKPLKSVAFHCIKILVFIWWRREVWNPYTSIWIYFYQLIMYEWYLASLLFHQITITLILVKIYIRKLNFSIWWIII